MSDQKQANRLIDETSPYLLQHAYNPVDWYPWGEAAFEKAMQENKPVFLSVGYSACHWCHVMEHESFENSETANVMNKHFVNIKVDREERPDVDEIYMQAVQLMTGAGGWPMSVFLTPDRVPFYGGTYFPPESRYGMPSFRHVLTSVSRHFHENPDNVTQASKRIQDRLESISQTPPGTEQPVPEDLGKAYRTLMENFDHSNGGFGQQPKFPNAMNIEVMLREYVRSGNKEALELACLALRKMAYGGIYDQIGGGFHRYSVDDRWLVPHFEKMLYDNALLVPVYVKAFQLTGDPLFGRVIGETLSYVMREMTHPDGGFYSTQDADSEGEEGKFFVWTPEEIEGVLNQEEAQLFCRYFDVSPGGNFEGKNILNVPVPAEELAHFLEVDADRLLAVIKKGRETLFEAREKRVKPGRDDKIQANWNGLMISAFARAYQALGNAAHKSAAENAARFVLDHMRQDDGRLLHVYKDRKARFNGYQDDYACVIAALVDLYEITFDCAWLDAAVALSEVMVEQFWDDAGGSFFFTGRDHEALIIRSKNPYDNATPSGNSVGAMALMRLGTLVGRTDFVEKASQTVRAFLPYVRQLPSGFGQMANALDLFIHGPVEVALLGQQGEQDLQALLEVVHKAWRPYAVVCCAPDSKGEGALPLLAEKSRVEGRATAYVCRNFVCSAPVTDAGALEKLLDDQRPSQ